MQYDNVIIDDNVIISDNVIIVDFGSQFTNLIGKNTLKAGVASKIVKPEEFEKIFAATQNCKAIILSGGPESVTDNNQSTLIDKIIEKKIPVLAICYGFQLLAHSLGGKIKRVYNREFGAENIKIVKESPILKNLKQKEYKVWMSHSDYVQALPCGFTKIASTKNIEFAAASDEQKKLYGLQFHPEVVHTDNGYLIIENFLLSIAGCKPKLTPLSYQSKALCLIREQIGDKKHAICALSGGVDSTVAAVIAYKAIGKRLHCVIIDTGLMRTNECIYIKKLFREKMNIFIKIVNAKKLFLNALKNVTEPEKKRKIIGTLFIREFEKYAKSIKNVEPEFLIQGTIYPDVIESMTVVGGKKVTIKSHHNVGGVPKNIKLKIVEPIRELFKDEVRKLGANIGIPAQFLNRHPFPGPGIAIRIPGKITKAKCDMLRKADDIFLDQIEKAQLYDKIWQAFVVLLPVKSVGVMGDNRSYQYACSLRAITSKDGMTAQIYPFDSQFLSKTATRIVNEVQGINRVLYDCTSKPPATIEWE